MSYTLPPAPACAVYKMPDGSYHYVFTTHQDAAFFAHMCSHDLHIDGAEAGKPRVPLQNKDLHVVQVSAQENIRINAKLRSVHQYPEKMLSDRVLKAADYVKHYLLKSYTNHKNPPGRSQWEVRLPNGKMVNRPNHGLAHSERCAAYVPYVADYLKLYYNPMIPADLLTPERMELIQIAMMFSVAGRENEAGFIAPNEKDKTRKLIAKDYFSYRKKSAELFKAYCAENHLTDSDSELAYVTQLLEAMGDPSIKHPLYLLINIAHKLDLLRCYDPEMSKGSIEDYIRANSDPPDNKDVTELMRYAAECIKATGNRLVTEVNEKGRLVEASSKDQNYQNIFYECSTDTQACLAQIDKVAPPKFSKKVPSKSKRDELIEKCPKIYDFREKENHRHLVLKSAQEAQFFIDILKQYGYIGPDHQYSMDENGVHAIVKLHEAQFRQIEHVLRYHRVEIPSLHSTESTLLDEQGQYQPLALIKNCQAAIRSANSTSTVDSRQLDYDWYVKQLNDPIHDRPLKRTDMSKQTQRKHVRDQRTQALLVRDFRQVDRLSQQKPQRRNPSLRLYWNRLSQAIARPVPEIRGQAVNTQFAKKMSHSVLRPDGKIIHFENQGAINSLNIGFLSDINEMHLHGERYMWRRNVITNEKFWIGKGALDNANLKPTKDYIAERGKGVPLRTLQDELRKDAIEHADTIPHWNEVLVGGSKTALKGLFATHDDLIDRLNLVLHYLRIKSQYGIDVPLLIVDGNNEPKMYTEAMIRDDLRDAAILLHAHRFKYNPTKTKAMQKEILKSLFKQIADASDLSHIPHGKEDLNKMLSRIKVIGGKEREDAYIMNEWHKGLAAQKKCFLRAVTLGHADLVHKMLGQGFDVREILKSDTHETALHIAIRHHHNDVVAVLLQYSADAEALDNQGLTPRALVERSADPNLAEIMKTKKIPTRAAIDFDNFVFAEYKRLGKKDFVLSKDWFAHLFPHHSRDDQLTFLQLSVMRHLAKAINGDQTARQALNVTLDMIEQTMYTQTSFATSARSRLQTIIEQVRSQISPVEITDAQREQHIAAAKALLEKGDFHKTFKNKMLAYSPKALEHKQSTYKK